MNYSVSNFKNNSNKRYRTIGISFLLILLAIGVGLYIVSANKIPVPDSIVKQTNFDIFYPQKNKYSEILKSTFKYDKGLKQLSYVVSYSDKKITFSEQSSPDSFTDDPTFYPKFIDKLNRYSSFESLIGSVYLTMPSGTGRQTAVMNAKGTLLFAQINSGSLQDDAWKKLFNTLTFTL